VSNIASLRSFALLAILAVILLLAPAKAFAGTDPNIRWKTLSSEHFKVHFYQGGELMARRVMSIANSSHHWVGELLGLYPSQLVEISLWDDVDSANGWASVYPYDKIRLFAAPPGPDSELGVFSDYLSSLVVHEYTHIVHMDEVSKIPGFVNKVIGKTFLPNGAIQKWFIEGLAVFMESQLPDGGRLGSSQYKMMLRQAALGGTFPQLSQLTVTPIIWPRGTSPYLFGGFFFEFLAQKFGLEAITKFIKNYGANVIPFLLNTVAKRHFGTTFYSLWSEFHAQVIADSEKHLAELTQLGLIQGERLTKGGEFNGRAVFKDPRHVVWVKSDGRSMSGLFQLDIEKPNKKPQRLVDCDGGCHSVAAHRGRIFSTSTSWNRLVYQYGEIFELKDGLKKLTSRSRARDLTVFDDKFNATTIAYVRADYDQASIVSFTVGEDKPSEREKVIIQPGLFSDLGDPVVLPGSEHLVFTGAKDGQWDLWSVNLETGQLQQLTNDKFLDRDPVPTPDGRFIVFSSDHEGVFDLFALELATGQLFRITREPGGAFWPAVSPAGTSIVYSAYGPKGYDLAMLPLEPQNWIAIDDTKAPHADSPLESAQTPPPFPMETDFDGDATPYRATSLKPRSIIPRWAFSGGGNNRLGFEFTGSDILDRHYFLAAFDADLTRITPYGALQYKYFGLFPDLSLDVVTWNGTDRAIIDDRIKEVDARNWMINAGASLPIPGRVVSFRVSLGYSIRWKMIGEIPKAHEPASTTPSRPESRRLAGLTASASFSWLRSYAKSVSTERGLSGGISVGGRHKWLGSDGKSLTITGTLDGYVPMPWGHGHVLALLTSGATSIGDMGTIEVYGQGGFPVQDMVMAIINNQPLSGRYLRGYGHNAFVGNSYFLGNLEYRFPIFPIFRSLGTIPLSARYLHGAVFADLGRTWTNDSSSGFNWAIGAELALGINLFLARDATLKIGYAHGFADKGKDTFYFLFSP